MKLNKERFEDALKKSRDFWQEKLLVQHWQIDDPKEAEPGFSHLFACIGPVHYRRVAFLHMPLDSESYDNESARSLARLAAHEIAHCILGPLRDLRHQLANRWEMELADATETVCDHIGSVVWRLITEDERQMIIGWFEAAEEKPDA